MTRTTQTDERTQTDTDGVTRRALTRTVLSSGAVLLTPAAVSVTRGATSSGEVELSTSSTVPTDTNIEVRVYEDTNADGKPENQQAEDLSGGSETFPLAGLGGNEASGIVYWLEITLTTSDDTVTPSLDSATVTLPEEATTPEQPTETDTPVGERERQGIEELWDNFLVFVAIAVGALGAIAGLGSRSMALGGFAAYLVFAHIAVETGHQLLTNILYVTLVLVIIGMAFKLWRLEFGGST